MRVPIVVGPGGILPDYQSEGAAGLDLCCSEPFELEPGERKLVPTGLRVAIPAGFEGQVRPRSGLAIRHGISMVNAPGTVDSDYRGELKVILVNLGHEKVAFDQGERIAQMVIAPVMRVVLEPVADLPETVRGYGGFGSTGTSRPDPQSS